MAKSINLIDSTVKIASVERNADGTATVTVVGYGVDDGSNQIPAKNYVINFADLPANVQNTGNNFIKHLSREFNKMVANEDVETWEDPI